MGAELMGAIIGSVLGILALLAGVFGWGRSKGKSAAELKATNEKSAEVAAAAEQRNEVLKNAVEVQQNINNSTDSAVDQRLREKWKSGASGS